MIPAFPGDRPGSKRQRAADHRSMQIEPGAPPEAGRGRDDRPRDRAGPASTAVAIIRGKALIFWDPKVPGKRKKLDAIDTDQITPAADCVSESLDTLDERWKAGVVPLPDARLPRARPSRRDVPHRRRSLRDRIVARDEPGRAEGGRRGSRASRWWSSAATTWATSSAATRSTSGCTSCRARRRWPTRATATSSASIRRSRALTNETQGKTYEPVPLTPKEDEIRRAGGIFAVGRREFPASVEDRAARRLAGSRTRARRMTTTEQIVWAHRVDKDAAGPARRDARVSTPTCCRRPTARRRSPSTRSTRSPAATRSTRGRRRSPTTTSCSPAATTTRSRRAIGRAFARAHGLEKPYYATPGDGIFHFYFPEQGLVLPGQFIPGADSHSRAYGAYGAVGIGVGSTTLGFGWATGYVYFTLPKARRVVFTGRAAAVGQRQGHRARAAAAVGGAAVAGHVGGARRRRPAAADRLSQHDRQHDGGSRGAERHLRAGRRSPTRGTARRASSDLPYPPFAPGADAVYEIDETLDLDAVSADDREAVQPGQRVRGRRGRARAAHVRQGDDRVVHERQLRRSAAGRARDSRPRASAGSRKRRREFVDLSRVRRRRPADRATRSAAGRRVDRRRVPLGRRPDPRVVVRALLRPGSRRAAAGQRAITSFNRNWQNRMGVGGEGYLASPAVVAARRSSATWRRRASSG